MPIPRAVLREEEELNALVAEQEAANAAAEEAPGQAQETVEAQVVQQPDSEPIPEPISEPNRMQEEEGTPDRQDLMSSLQSQLDKLNHKFSVLQGKYNSETRQLRTQVAARDAEIERLKASPLPSAQTVQQDDGRYNIPEEEYDEDVVRLAERVADSKTKQAVSKLEERLAELRHEAQAQVEDRYWTDLAGIVPEWEQIDQREDWKNWLNTVDPYTGQPLQTLLEHAVGSRDAIRTANFFSEFEKYLQSGTSTQPTAQRKPSVQSQVVPRTGATTPAPQKKTMTIDEWSELADALSKGKYSNNADKFLEIEAELNAAMKEGRVTF